MKNSIALTFAFFFTWNIPGYTQDSAQAERLRELNAQTLNINDHLKQVAPAALGPVVAGAAPILKQRFAALRDLIEQNPAEALLMAFSPSLLEELKRDFPQSAQTFETRGSWQAPVEYFFEDGVKFAASKAVVRLKIDNKAVLLYFADPNPPLFKSGDLLSVSGVRAGDRLAVEKAQVTVAPAAAMCSTTGPQKIAVILANLKSYSLPAGMTTSFVKGVMLGNSGGGAQNTPDWSVDDFWQQNSDGQASVNRTGAGSLAVAGPYTLPDDYNAGGSCDYSGLVAAAAAAADGDLNYEDFSRTLIIFPPNNACNWAGLGTVGCWYSYCPGDGMCNYSWVLQRSDQMWDRRYAVMLTTHELGHNLTLGHSNSRDFGAEALGPLGSAGTPAEYGDYFSSMGSWNLGFYNADHAINLLGWLKPDTNFIDVSTSGSYSIPWYGTRPAGFKALRIQRGAPGDNANLILESRQSRGIYDPDLISQVRSGALLHYRDSRTGNATHLLDLTPGSSASDFTDPALALTNSWQDPYTNLRISVDSLVNDALNVTVSYGAAPCTPANPTVTLSPSNPGTSAGVPVTYTMTVTNNDTQACSPATFTLNSTAPAGWLAGTFSPQSLTIAPGGSATSSFTKTPPASVAIGTYLVNAAAAGSGGASTSSGTGYANCTVSSYSISGRVTAGSSGVGGATITLSRSSFPSVTAKTDASGNFSFTSLTSGAYTATPSLAGYKFTPSSLGVSPPSVTTANFSAVASVPTAPVTPSPALNATGVSLTPVLTWTGGAGAASFDVYFGLTYPAPLAANTISASYTPGPLVGSKKYYWKVVAKNSAGSAASLSWVFTTKAGSPPPSAPASPSPANTATGVLLTPTLTWTGGVGATSYAVYFGLTSPPAFAANTTVARYKPPTLSAGKKYYWSVVAKNTSGSTASATWAFSTQAAASPPSAPASPSPANTATGVLLTPTLGWAGASGATSYDVYFGVANPPPFAANTVSASFRPGTLGAGKTYFWRVVAKNTGGSTASATWMFKTQ